MQPFLTLTAAEGHTEFIRVDRVERISKILVDQLPDSDNEAEVEQDAPDQIEVTAVHLIGKSRAVLVQEGQQEVVQRVRNMLVGNSGDHSTS